MTLQRLKDYGLQVRKDECVFFQSLVEYLGHGQGYLGRPSSSEREPTTFFPGVTELLRRLYPELSNEAEATASVDLLGQNMEMD